MIGSPTTVESENFTVRRITVWNTVSPHACTSRSITSRLRIDGVLGTMFDGRTLHSREVMQRLVEAWGDKVFHTVIRRTVKFSDSTVAGEPITTYASTSPGADSYRQLAREVLARHA